MGGSEDRNMKRQLSEQNKRVSIRAGEVRFGVRSKLWQNGGISEDSRVVSKFLYKFPRENTLT